MSRSLPTWVAATCSTLLACGVTPDTADDPQDLDLEPATAEPTSPIAGCALLPPLADHPLRDRPVVIEELFVEGIRPAARQLDRYTFRLGPVELELGRTTVIDRDAGNFNVRTVEIGRQATVMIGEVRYAPGADVYRVYLGGEIHELAREFSDPSEVLYANRKFQLVIDPLNQTVALGDNEDGVLYTLAAYAPDRYRIASATLPRLAGLTRGIAYDYASASTAQVAQLRFGTVETLSFARSGTRIDAITSSMDPARSVVLGYAGTGAATRLTRVRRGGDPSSDTGALDGVRLGYTGCTPLLTSVTSLRGKPIVAWRLGQVGGRTVYDGVRLPGDTGWTYTLSYPAAGAVHLARAETPNDPLDVVLDGDGRVTRAEDACKVDVGQGGRADNVYVADYDSAGETCPGRLREERWPTWDKFATTHY